MYLCVGGKGRRRELEEDTQQNILCYCISEKKKRKKKKIDSGLNILNKMYLKITPGQWVLLEAIVVGHVSKRQF